MSFFNRYGKVYIYLIEQENKIGDKISKVWGEWSMEHKY